MQCAIQGMSPLGLGMSKQYAIQVFVWFKSYQVLGTWLGGQLFLAYFKITDYYNVMSFKSNKLQTTIITKDSWPDILKSFNYVQKEVFITVAWLCTFGT